jgi:glycosyltransferase involved in cell wall biosynthesis
MILDILIPTFNRELDLQKNLKLLATQIQNMKNPHEINIIISDNASTDNTVALVMEMKKIFPTTIKLLQSQTNRGLEANAVKILSEATSPWVMFLGDDDFLPDGYIEFVLNNLKNNQIGGIIPGFTCLYPDGSTKIKRFGTQLKINPGFSAVLKFSQFGHQLSGLVVPRNKKMLETYLAHQNYRNIYLFIYFVAFTLYRETTLYTPQYQVLVTQNNTKDWNYDDSGLLTEIYLNYLILFKHQPLKILLTSLYFTHQQIWRLHFTKNFKNNQKTVKNIFQSSKLPLMLRLSIIIFCLFRYIYWFLKTSFKQLLLKITYSSQKIES